MRPLATEPRSTTGPLFFSQFPRGTILLTLYSVVCDRRVSKTGPIPFYWFRLLYQFLLFFYFYYSSTIFPYPSFSL